MVGQRLSQSVVVEQLAVCAIVPTRLQHVEAWPRIVEVLEEQRQLGALVPSWAHRKVYRVVQLLLFYS